MYYTCIRDLQIYENLLNFPPFILSKQVTDLTLTGSYVHNEKKKTFTNKRIRLHTAVKALTTNNIEHILYCVCVCMSVRVTNTTYMNHQHKQTDKKEFQE